MIARAAILLLLTAGPAAAHGGPFHDLLEAGWTFDPWIVGPLAAVGLLYGLGTRQLWRHAGRGRGVPPWQAGCFWAGWLAMAAALVSPLHWWGERVFTAHMLEHGMLMTVGAPLVAVARPYGAMLWALPMRLRRAFRLTRGARAGHAWRLASDPLAATLLHGVAIWAWHMPQLYGAALEHVAIHRLQHVCFVATALLFWWSLLYGARRQRGYGVALFCLFATLLHTGALGLALGFSRHLWYPQQASQASDWGLTALEDQQLAGLVMWVPMGLIYTAAALLLASWWITWSGRTGHVAAH